MLPCCAVLCYKGHGLLPAGSQAARFACDLSSAQADPLGMDWLLQHPVLPGELHLL